MSKHPKIDGIKPIGLDSMGTLSFARNYDIHERLHRVQSGKAITVERSMFNLALRSLLLDHVCICIEVYHSEAICIKRPTTWMLPSAWDLVMLDTGECKRVETDNKPYSYLQLPAGFGLIERPSAKVPPLLYVNDPLGIRFDPKNSKNS